MGSEPTVAQAVGDALCVYKTNYALEVIDFCALK
jgi:hypothetical protein